MPDEPVPTNGNNPEVKIASPPAQRVRASGPILLLAMLFVVASFLTWYFTWFGRDLTDAKISEYLLDDKKPRHVQHALLQIQQRIERGDQNAKQWYPRIIALAGSPETEFRLTTAWLMGADNGSNEFHEALKKLLLDSEPIVRRNAALALVRFNDHSGHNELISMLQPFTVTAPADGMLQSNLAPGAQVSRGALLGRILQPDKQIVEVRSPLNGIVDEIKTSSGATLTQRDPLFTIKPDEQSIWEALRALAVVGQTGDLSIIEGYANGGSTSDRLKQQAAMTANAIKSRAK